MNKAEAERARGFSPGIARENFEAGRIMARVLASGLRGIFAGNEVPPSETDLLQSCGGCGSTAHGTPALQVPNLASPLRLSYARNSGWIVVALHPENRAVGADLADIDDRGFAQTPAGELFEAYAYSGTERRLLKEVPPRRRPRRRAEWWTLKEALAKVSGEGLGGPAGIPVVAGADRHEFLDRPTAQAIGAGPGDVDSLGTRLPANLVASVVWH
ncbi:MAG: 4'-phosphopantetheinyl transferase superfamily protein [Micrococcaceae bacterium]|nr:4'-phosphopantetheinyl transferase superfamily protein [Micrococcaceae bacterium]